MFRKANNEDVESLFIIWFKAVKATHSFLSDEDFDEISHIVKNDFLPNVEADVYVDGKDMPLGFMTMTGSEIDALFIDPDFHNIGIGKAFVKKAMDAYDEITVDVNEQNVSAHNFYKYVGFIDTGRSEKDSSGKPYPIVHMKYRALPSS